MTPSIKNNIQKTILTLLLTLLFISCGSSGGKKNNDNKTINPPSCNQEKCTVSGTVKDYNTNKLLEYVTVAILLEGSHDTNTKGEYKFRDIPTGTEVQITASKKGYVPFSKKITVQKDEILNFFLTPEGNIGDIQGVILNDKGETISGASISIAGKNAISDNTGFYRIRSVALGSQQMTVSKVSYIAAVESVNIKLNALVPKNITLKREGVVYPLSFNISANKPTAQTNENITFNITNESSNIVRYEWRSNLSGVLSNNKTFSTSNLTIGTHTITCKAIGKDGQTLQKTLQVAISQPQNTGTINGIIKNTNGIAVANVDIKVGDYRTISQANGVYTIPNVAYGVYSLFAFKHKYKAYSTEITINNRENLTNITVEKIDGQKPTTPSNINSSNILLNSISLSWSTSSIVHETIVNYYISYKTSSGSYGNEISTTSKTKTINNLTANTNYTFRIRAKDDEGEYSDYGYSSIIKTAQINQKPTIPTNIQLTNITQNSITISWNSSSDSDGNIASYYISYKTSSGDYGSEQSVSLLTKIISGLTANTSYTFRIRAKDDDNEYGEYGYSSSATTLQAINHKPTTPTNIQLTNTTQNSITVSWNNSSDSDGNIVSYYISYKTSSGSYGSEQSTSSLTKIVNGLTANTSYTFRVRARDDGEEYSGYGYSSSFMIVEPLPEVIIENKKPNPPTSITSSDITPTSIHISWNPPPPPADDDVGVGIQGYYISYKQDYGGHESDGSYSNEIHTTNYHKILNNLEANTKYIFRVRLKDDNNAYSDYAYSPTFTTTEIMYANIIGRVTHMRTHENIKGVTISINNQTSISDENGSYSIQNIPYGTHRVRASLDGYEVTEYDTIIIQPHIQMNIHLIPYLNY